MSEIKMSEELTRKQRVLLSDKLNVTLEEASALTGIGPTSLKKLADAGYIPTLEIGSKRIYPRWALEEFSRNFMFKRIDLNTLEISSMKTGGDYERLIQQLQAEKKELNDKLDKARKALA